MFGIYSHVSFHYNDTICSFSRLFVGHYLFKGISNSARYMPNDFVILIHHWLMDFRTGQFSGKKSWRMNMPFAMMHVSGKRPLPNCMMNITFWAHTGVTSWANCGYKILTAHFVWRADNTPNQLLFDVKRRVNQIIFYVYEWLKNYRRSNRISFSLLEWMLDCLILSTNI